MPELPERTDHYDPSRIQTAESIDRRLIAFGKEAAHEAENMTEADTAEYITAFLRMAIEQLTGIPAARPRPFQIPTEVN